MTQFNFVTKKDTKFNSRRIRSTMIWQGIWRTRWTTTFIFAKLELRLAESSQTASQPQQRYLPTQGQHQDRV